MDATPDPNGTLHHLQHLARANVAGYMQGVNLTGVFIYHAQHAVRTSLDRGVMNEVPGPTWPRWAAFFGKPPVDMPRRLCFFLGGGTCKLSSRRTLRTRSLLTRSPRLRTNLPTLSEPSSACSMLNSTMALSISCFLTQGNFGRYRSVDR
jgi:hypothetical protein